LVLSHENDRQRNHIMVVEVRGWRVAASIYIYNNNFKFFIFLVLYIYIFLFFKSEMCHHIIGIDVVH
jgi:hypothetical protein